MNSSIDLLVVACRTLEAPASSPALRAAAADALLCAIGGGITPPADAVLIIWKYWTLAPGNRSWRHTKGIGELPSDVVRAEALAILAAEDSGEDLRDLAADLLSGAAYAAHFDDRFILALVERARTRERALEVVRLVVAAHAARGLGATLLRMTRDRFAGSAVSAVREASIAIAAQIDEPDLAHIEALLNDPHADARAAMAYALTDNHPGCALAIAVVEARLRVEVHPNARVALLRAQASLIDDSTTPRRRRRP